MSDSKSAASQPGGHTPSAAMPERLDESDFVEFATTGLPIPDSVLFDEMIRRYNAHADLLAACEAALNAIDLGTHVRTQRGGEGMSVPEGTAIETLRAALSKARGEAKEKGA